MTSLALLTLLVLPAADPAPPVHQAPFAIRVVDEATGRGVPLVELRTVHQVRYVTDSAGYVAFLEPGLMDRPVFFSVSSHGYEFPKDGFGQAGKTLHTKPGGSAELRVKRQNIAERLYRVTGGGIYADSVLLGRPTPITQNVLNAAVLGSDSVVNAVYRGRVYWFWGDTLRPNHPLGLFHAPGATSPLPNQDGFTPNDGVPLKYFTDDRDIVRDTAKMPGEGPTWINGLVVLPDAEGRERLVVAYEKVRPPLDIYQRGWAMFNDERQMFESLGTFAADAPLRPHGHPLRHTTDGVEHVYFGDPQPWTRVRATVEAWRDLTQYEGFTAVLAGSPADAPHLDRDEQGRLRFAWRRGVPPWSRELEVRLAKAGVLRDDDRFARLQDVDSPREVNVHRGSVAWNPWRKRWVMICVEFGGASSLLGEVWYTESESVTGPWRRAVKIASHNKYSFYNPKHHPQFDAEGGRVIYFEGTYTQMFSGREEATPRYEYNQIMYRLDLADARLERAH